MAKPTPHEALALIDKALSSINTNRQTHAALMGAMSVLREVAGPEPKQAAPSKKS